MSDDTFDETEHEISVNELKVILKKDKNVMLIDVRQPEEHHMFNIGGKLIPLADLPHRVHDIQFDKHIVLYCRSGNRSMQAVKVLIDLGFKNVKSLTGGMLAWQQAALKAII